MKENNRKQIFSNVRRKSPNFKSEHSLFKIGFGLQNFNCPKRTCRARWSIWPKATSRDINIIENTGSSFPNLNSSFPNLKLYF